MENNGNNFYVVRKGDMVGMFKSLSDCQAQVGSEQVSPSSISPVESERIVRIGYLGLLEPSALKCPSCVLFFDGASKGNAGKAGSGAVVRADDDSGFWRLREGIGMATNNVAEYKALIMGLKFALKKGFTQILVLGDSKLVCMQVAGLWRVKRQNMVELCNVARRLKNKFSSFEISLIDRKYNAKADAQANAAIHLGDGETKEECVYDKRN